MLLVEIPLSPKLYKPIIQVMYPDDHGILVYNKLSPSSNFFYQNSHIRGIFNSKNNHLRKN